MILKNLVKVANKLDSLGLTSEADIIDNLLRKISSEDIFFKDRLIENPETLKAQKANKPEPDVDRSQLISILENRVSEFFGNADFISVQNVIWTSDEFGNSFWRYDYVLNDDVQTTNAWLISPEELGISSDNLNEAKHLIKTSDGIPYIVYTEF